MSILDAQGIVDDMRRLLPEGFTRRDLLAAAEARRRALVALEDERLDGLLSWDEIERDFGVTRIECAEDVESYCAGLYDDYDMTVLLRLDAVGVAPGDMRRVAEMFERVFPDAEVGRGNPSSYCLVLDSDDKQRWGFTLAKLCAMPTSLSVLPVEEKEGGECSTTRS